MIREGDNFDYNRWLKEVREEEAQAKQTEGLRTSSGLAPAEIAVPIKPFDQLPRPNPALPLTAKTTLARALSQSHRQANQTPKALLRRWLEKVRCAWEDFQASRSRDAVYGYLEAVFPIVAHFRVRRRTNRLLRHVFEFANLRLNKRTDPFAAVIRCTSKRDIGSEIVSKWARALRYVARSKEPGIGLRTFMKEVGGINACANRYAKRFWRRH